MVTRDKRRAEHGRPHRRERAVGLQNSSFLMQNSSFLIQNHVECTIHHFFNAEFIIFNAEFIMCNTKFINLDTNLQLGDELLRQRDDRVLGRAVRAQHPSNCKINGPVSIENHHFAGAILHSFCMFNRKNRGKLAFILQFYLLSRRPWTPC